MLENLIQLRKTRNLRQEDVAKVVGVAKSTYSYWEKGAFEPDIKSLRLLAGFFNVSIDYLLGNSTDLIIPDYRAIEPEKAKGIWLSSLLDIDKQLIESVLRLDEKHKYQVFGYIESMARA